MMDMQLLLRRNFQIRFVTCIGLFHASRDTKAQTSYTPIYNPAVVVGNGVWELQLQYSRWDGVFSNKVSFPTDSLFYDTSSSVNYWAVTSDFSVTLSPVSAIEQDRLAYSAPSSGSASYAAGRLNLNVQAANSYELHTTCTSSCSCPYTASLAQNSTTYSCYMLAPLGHLFTLQASVQLGSQVLGGLQLMPWLSSSFVSSSSSNFSGSAFVSGTSSRTRYAAYDFTSGALRWCLANQAASSSDPGFLVNTTAFGNGANLIGINASSFSSCLGSYATSGGCSSSPYGACTQVFSGSPYDQFSAFRGFLWGSLVPYDSTWTCQFLYNGPSQTGASDFATQYSCQYSGAKIVINVNVAAAVLPLTYGYSAIQIVNFGQAIWQVGSLSGNLFVALKNSGNITGQFSVATSSCSSGVTFSSAAITLTLEAGLTGSFTFTVGVPQSGARGSCTMAISGFRVPAQAGLTITFQAIPNSPPPPPPSPPPPLSPPPPPSSIYPYLNATLTFQGAGPFDSTFFARMQACISASANVPVASVIIVSAAASTSQGRRLHSSVFIVLVQTRFAPSVYLTAANNYQALLTNSITSAFSSDSSFYSSYGPVAASFTAYPSDFAFVTTTSPSTPQKPSPPPPSYKTASPPGSSTPSSPPPPAGVSCPFGIPSCGTHGTLTAPCNCVCDTGWTTDPIQDFSNYTYCGITATDLAKREANTIAPATPPPPVASSTTAKAKQGLMWYYWLIIIAALVALITMSLYAVKLCQSSSGKFQHSKLGKFWINSKEVFNAVFAKKYEEKHVNALFEVEAGDDKLAKVPANNENQAAAEPVAQTKTLDVSREARKSVIMSACSNLLTMLHSKGCQTSKILQNSMTRRAKSKSSTMATESKSKRFSFLGAFPKKSVSEPVSKNLEKQGSEMALLTHQGSEPEIYSPLGVGSRMMSDSSAQPLKPLVTKIATGTKQFEQGSSLELRLDDEFVTTDGKGTEQETSPAFRKSPPHMMLEAQSPVENAARYVQTNNQQQNVQRMTSPLSAQAIYRSQQAQPASPSGQVMRQDRWAPSGAFQQKRHGDPGAEPQNVFVSAERPKMAFYQQRPQSSPADGGIQLVRQLEAAGSGSPSRPFDEERYGRSVNSYQQRSPEDLEFVSTGGSAANRPLARWDSPQVRWPPDYHPPSGFEGQRIQQQRGQGPQLPDDGHRPEPPIRRYREDNSWIHSSNISSQPGLQPVPYRQSPTPPRLEDSGGHTLHSPSPT